MKRLHLTAAGLALILTGCGGAAPDETAAPDGAGALALVGAQLIDATGAPPVADSVVVVRDGRIESAGPRDATPVPEGAETLDVSGQTIIPGLVNLHVHYREGPEEMERQFRSQLHYGVTTARSIGSDSPERVAHLLASAGRSDAPRTYTAGTGISPPRRFHAARPPRPPPMGRAGFSPAPAASPPPAATPRPPKKRRASWCATRSRSACTSSRCGSTRSPSRV